VDVQNTALLTKVKKTLRKMSRKMEKNGEGLVKLLNMEDMNSEEEDAIEEDMESERERSQSEDEGNDDNDDDSEDENTRRIRERMERSMAEMDDFSNSEDEEDDTKEIIDNKKTSSPSDDPIDPSREDLYDGFFDLHEMENFADEEEEMLPDEAFGEPKPDDEETLEERKKSLPHLMAREGKEDNDDDDDDEEFNALEKQVESSVRRKRYRDDEDIDALAGMYNDVNEEANDDDSDEEGVDMTAVDFFGPPNKPSKAFIEKSREKKENKNVTFDDDDSWNDHDFSAEGKDWRDQESDDNNQVGKEKELEESSDEIEAEENDNGNDETSNKLSNYAERSSKLEVMTKELEKDLLAEKPWQMVGEAKATQRPTNSLLEVTPTFEFATKMAPMITAEHTVSIEDVIKRRILAEDWDDVIPRELPDIGLDKRNGELPEVSQEKSKLSLGELYEREYLKKATGYDADKVEKETEEEKVKNEMKMLFANLCSKLDALSNYHFAPRPVADEAEVKSSATPAVAMEEVLPLHVSDAQAMAPEEIFANKKGRQSVLHGESEMNQTDRKRLRQSKKAARRKARKAKLADEKLISRLKPELGLNNPYEKRKMREELQMARASGRVITGEIDQNEDYKTSAKFFQKMQTDVQMSLTEDDSNMKKRKRDGTEDTKKSSSFKL
jgi:U3 small nucleolar RNA-associated protein MPP10